MPRVSGDRSLTSGLSGGAAMHGVGGTVATQVVQPRRAARAVQPKRVVDATGGTAAASGTAQPRRVVLSGTTAPNGTSGTTATKGCEQCSRGEWWKS